MSDSSSSADPSSGSRYFKLGLFVLVSVALLVAGVIVLGFGSVFEKKFTAETIVAESINGLDVGSAVKYRGVTIGKVSRIAFADDTYGLDTAQQKKSFVNGAIVIQMAVELKKAFPGLSENEATDRIKHFVEQGLRARVTMAGISGQSYVELDMLDPKKFPIQMLGITPKELFIPSAPSEFGEVLTDLEQIAGDLRNANLGKVVGHVNDLATQATDAVADVRRVIAANQGNIDQTVARLPAVADQLKAVSARANDLLHDPRVERALTGLGGVGDSAGAAVADLRRVTRRVDDLLAAEGDDIRGILADLRRTAANAAALTDDAHQNPSRLLFGQPPPRKQPDK